MRTALSLIVHARGTFVIMRGGMRPTLWAALAGVSVELPEELHHLWPELAIARYRSGGLPPRIAGWLLGASGLVGITLGRTIWLAPFAGLDPALLLHEIRHVQQFAASRAFPLIYLLETLRRGYHANRFEVDARHYAERRLQETPRQKTDRYLI